MKKLILLIVLCLGAKSFAQTNGITYQAVILNPSGEQLPGVNNTNAPMVDKNICMQFQFIDAFAKLEYQETIQTKTDSFGMVNLVIGSGKQTAGYAASFQSIEWNALKKSMIVSINTSGSCSSFTEISNQPFTAVPFAFSAINSGNVTGVVAIENGGTNAITIIGAKINLGLEKLDNTSDLDKPISNATLVALNLNTSAISVNATAISLNTAKVGITTQQASAITANTVKVGYTDALVSANTDVAANNAKTGITSSQASAITANTAKVGYTDALVSANIDVAANTAKTGITSGQASAITANTAKVGYTDALVSSNTDVAANNAKTGITSSQASAITANTAKVGYTDALVSANTDVAANTAKTGLTTAQTTLLGNTSGTNTGDQDISGIATNATNISSNDTDIATNVTAIALNTVKISVPDDSSATSGQVLQTNGSGTLSWVSATSGLKSIISKIADAPNTILSIGDFEFRYNSNNNDGFIEVRSSGGDNMMVFCHKNTGSWELGGSSSTKNYRNNTYVYSVWQPVISLWNGSAWNDRVTLSVYDSFEATMFSMGNGDAIPNPLKSYKIFASIDGYNQVFLKVEYSIN
jgi:hypothetical protein